jgi:branched-chain amino acid transport system substrate-binding protein
VYTTAATLLALAIVVAGCSSNSSGGGESKSTALRVLGTKHVATGTPVKVGYVYDGTLAGINQTADIDGTQAAVKYVNNYMNGIAGHPITLDTCSTQETPAGAKNCVAQFITDKVPVVLNGATGQGGELFGPLAEQGVPVFLDTGGDDSTFGRPGVAILNNGMLGIGGPALLAHQAGVKRVAIALIDLPSAVGPIKSAAPLFYGEFGIKTDYVAIPPGTPDASPQIDAELTNHPGQVMVVGDESTCVSVFKALANADYQGQKVILAGCTPGKTEGLTNLAGSYVFPGQVTNGSSKTVQTYNAVMSLYAPSSLDRTGPATTDYQDVIAFAEATSGLKGAVTKESIQQAIASSPPKPLPLAPGMTFQCNRKQFVIASSMCTANILEGRLDANAEPGHYSVVSGKALLNGGA